MFNENQITREDLPEAQSNGEQSQQDNQPQNQENQPPTTQDTEAGTTKKNFPGLFSQSTNNESKDITAKAEGKLKKDLPHEETETTDENSDEVGFSESEEEGDEGSVELTKITIQAVLPRIIRNFFVLRRVNYSHDDLPLFKFFAEIIQILNLQKHEIIKRIPEIKKGLKNLQKPLAFQVNENEVEAAWRPLDTALDYIWNAVKTSIEKKGKLGEGRKTYTIQKIYVILAGELTLLTKNSGYLTQASAFNSFFTKNNQRPLVFTKPITRTNVFEWVANYIIDDISREKNNNANKLQEKFKTILLPEIVENINEPSKVSKSLHRFAVENRFNLCSRLNYLQGVVLSLFDSLTYLAAVKSIVYPKQLSFSGNDQQPSLEHFSQWMENFNQPRGENNSETEEDEDKGSSSSPSFRVM